jgi:DNA topoisomerase-3|tara:strand:+ start:1164 stop:3479 length:2316 start_codon:yes stop_codon:yes gene_type:complete
LAFKEVIICEKKTQKDIFVKLFNLRKAHRVGDYNVAFYDNENGICVTHQSGHLLEQAPPEFYQPSLKRENKGWNVEDLPVMPKLGDFKLFPKKDKRAKALLAGIKWALVDCGRPAEITLAVDNDKEGELLGWEVLDYLRCINHPNISRMLYSALTPDAIQKAYNEKDPGSKWYSRYQAGLARSLMDWLIGMNVTMALSVINTEVLPPFHPLNSGRVIFAMSYLLALRERAIASFTPQDYFNEEVIFNTPKGESYVGRVEYPKEYLDPELGQLIDQNKAKAISEHIVKSGQGTVVDYKKENKKTGAPKGFHRTGFEIHMIKKFGMSLDDIDKAMQSLYSERALITYPRVEVVQLDTKMHADMPKYISAVAKNLAGATFLTDKEKELYQKAFKFADMSKVSKIWKKGIDDDESHHAIIPTDMTADTSKLTKDEFLIYRELCDRLIIQFLPDYEYASTQVTTDVNGVKCKSSGSTPLRMGWKALNREVDDDDDRGDTIPLLEQGLKVSVAKSETKTSTTKQPKHYTEAEFLADLEKPGKYVKNRELLKKIKNLQIGTGGTRRNHVSLLSEKFFITHKKEGKGKKSVKRFIPTKKLLQLSDIVPDYFKLPETTAYWEDSFNEIQAGKLSLEDFMKRQTQFLARFFKQLNEGHFRISQPIVDDYNICPDPCGGFTFLQVLKKKDFNLWRCKRCEAAYIDANGKHGTKLGSGGGTPRAEKKPLDKSKSCPCPSCKKGTTYFKLLPNKSFNLWECEGCKKVFFDKDDAPGNELSKKKK